MLCEVDWKSSENHSYLNPRMPEVEKFRLMEAISQVNDQFRGHLFLCSSGTTAQSSQDLKWVALSKEAFLAGADAVNRHLESHSKDVWIHTLPNFHVGGLGIWARAHLSGARVVEMNRWSPEGLMECIESQSGSLVSLVPAQIFDLVQREFVCPPSMRAVLVGGGALSPSLHQKARSLKWPVLTTYGMTETCSQIATLSLKNLSQDAGSLSMDILSHLEVSQTEDGRARIRGSSLLTALIYLSGPQRSEENRPTVVDPKEEGWYTTQDQVELFGRQLKVLGRQGDFIKIGGESVELTRLREILDSIKMQFQISADLALIPVPDERLGSVIYLLSDQNLSDENASKVMYEFSQKVVAFERIRQWRKLGQIPRTALGKLILKDCLEALKS